MKIEDLKKEILNFEDFYGQDIVQTDLIQKSKTKKQLLYILLDHRRFLEDQNCDALTHIDNFIKKLSLNDINTKKPQ